MCDNIVMFGPTHSGKSTLMGYLMVYDWTEEEYLKSNMRIKRKIEEMGLKFKRDMTLAYYVDTGKDERMIYDGTEVARGGSKRIHINKAALGIDLDCTFIDTPGSDIAWKHKHEGLFLGDVGIFIIEIRKLIELSRKIKGSNAYNVMVSQIFSPVYLWKHYKRMKRLIVVISKVDMELYSPYAIKRSENVLRSIDILKSVPIVPISVDVDKRESNNVVDCVCDGMKWYKGKSLVDEIKAMLQKEHEINMEESLTLAHIDRLFEKTKYNNQPAIRVKVLNGTIRIGDEIYVGPVKCKSNKENVLLRGIVLSLKHETRGSVNSLSRGEIGGIIFSKLWVGRERKKLTDIELKRTSMVYEDITSCRSGNLLYFNIEKKYLERKAITIMDGLDVGSRIKIIWFGKIIPLHLLNKIDNGTLYSIVLINTSSKNSKFMLPLKENGRLFYEEFVLQLSELLFVKAHLSDLEKVSEDLRRNALVVVEGKIEETDFLSESKLTFAYSYDQDKDQTNILWKDLSDIDLKRAMESTRKLLKAEDIHSYKTSILPQD